MRSPSEIVVSVMSCLLASSLMLLLLAVEAQLSLPHQHPDPEAVVQDVRRRVNESISRRQLFDLLVKDQCATGNPIDDCWRCNPNWRDPQILADCAIGFGQYAMGGKGGKIYYVTDPSDNDPVNPAPGTLRYGVIQSEPLWILFTGNMVIDLKYELIVGSYKTIDGRGPRVEITGKGCVIVEAVTNVIIHNIHIHHCKPSGNAKILISPTQIVERGPSDGDGISVLSSSKIWIDHCSLSYCTDGLIDVTHGSTAVTISNNFLTHHEKVMLLGHSDDFTADTGMQVTVAFNHFGEALIERMPRCRHGYFHVVNNDYYPWGMYAVGGSAAPTINSQGNRYVAPDGSKEVTKRMDTDESEWKRWNWRSEGDLMVNGAFFVPSGAELSPQFSQATSMAPLGANVIVQLTMNAGVTSLPSSSTPSNPGGTVPSPGTVGGGIPLSPGSVVGETPPSPGLVISGVPPYVWGGTYDPWSNGGTYGPRTSMAPESAFSILAFIMIICSTLYHAYQ